MTKSFGYSIISTVGVQQAGMAQSVAHLIGSEEVTGSIPVASFIKKVDFTRKMEDLRKRKPPEKRWFFVPDYYLTTIKIFLLIFHSSQRMEYFLNIHCNQAQSPQ